MRLNRLILFIHGVHEIGGAERELLLLIDRLPSSGFQLAVVSPGHGQLPEELRRKGVTVHSVLFPPWRKLLVYPGRRAAVQALCKVIASEQPAIIITVSGHQAVLGLDRMTSYGKAGNARVSPTFHVDVMIERLVSLYEKILGQQFGPNMPASA